MPSKSFHTPLTLSHSATLQPQASVFRIVNTFVAVTVVSHLEYVAINLSHLKLKVCPFFFAK